MFQSIKVPAPTEAESIQILHGIKERYESFHQLKYTDEALEAQSIFRTGIFQTAFSLTRRLTSLMKPAPGSSCSPFQCRKS